VVIFSTNKGFGKGSMRVGLFSLSKLAKIKIVAWIE
jgi:hypothetical protein